jgi:putative ABC transport system substrate-binding protein
MGRPEPLGQCCNSPNILIVWPIAAVNEGGNRLGQSFLKIGNRGSMRRREFIGLLGGAVVGWPTAARAQQGKLPTIGFSGGSSAAATNRWTVTFVKRLHELGWIEGKNVAIEYRWAEGRADRYAEIAAEFVRIKVAVIVTSGTEPVIAAKRVTSAIPIVFATAGDPVGSGLVASLARPGGNVTGLSNQQTDLAGKRLELLREIVPGLRRLAVIANISNPASVSEMRDVQAIAGTLGLQVTTSEIQRTEDIPPAFEALKGSADALYVVIDPLVSVDRVRINTLALAARLPTMHGFREFAQAGGLISYGPDFPDLFRRSAELVDKILRGQKPADIPVEQPTKFDLVINLTTAKALGLTMPPSLLARADDVIE